MIGAEGGLTGCVEKTLRQQSLKGILKIWGLVQTWTTHRQ